MPSPTPPRPETRNPKHCSQIETPNLHSVQQQSQQRAQATAGVQRHRRRGLCRPFALGRRLLLGSPFQVFWWL